LLDGWVNGKPMSQRGMSTRKKNSDVAEGNIPNKVSLRNRQHQGGLLLVKIIKNNSRELVSNQTTAKYQHCNNELRLSHHLQCLLLIIARPSLDCHASGT